MSENVSPFIGARELTEEEAKLIIPNYDIIVEELNKIRLNPLIKDAISFKKEYNNIFSILGSRGTGKTSLLYSLKKILESNDIVLPIIKPDTMTSDNKLITSIIGLLKEEVNNFNSNNRAPKNNSNFKDCVNDEGNIINEKYTEMLEYYCYNNKEYKDILARNYTGFSTYSKKTGHIFNSDYNFINSFNEFINELLKLKARINEDKEALLIILIDDIDLRVEKIEQVIDILTSYLNHPRIACIISGDYNTFISNLNLSLLKKNTIFEVSRLYVEKSKLLKEYEDLTESILKKIMPPAFRYEITPRNLEGRARYVFGNNTSTPMMIIFKQIADSCGSNENPFYYYSNIFEDANGEGSNPIPLKPFFNILDSTVRGLVNVYYALSNANDDIKKGDKISFSRIKTIIDTIINSNPIFIANRSSIFKEVILWGADQISSSIDFSYISKFDTNSDDSNINIEDQKKRYIFSIFNLCYLVKLLLPEIKYSSQDYEEAYIKAFNLLKVNPILDGYIYKSNNKTERESVHKKDIIENLFEINYEFSLHFYQALTYDVLNYDIFFDYEFDDNQILYAFYLALKRYSKKNGNDKDKCELTEYEFLLKLHNSNEGRFNEVLSYFRIIASEPSWFDSSVKYLMPIISLKNGDYNSERYHIYSLLISTIYNDEKSILSDYIKGKTIYQELSNVVENYIKSKDGKSASNPYRSYILAVRKLDKLDINDDIDTKDKIEKRIKMIEEKIRDEISKVFDSKVKILLDRTNQNTEDNSNNFDYQITGNPETLFEKFYNGVNGGKDTIYSKVIENIKGIIDNNKGEEEYVFQEDKYFKIYKELNDLSINYKVWYGRKEAEDLLKGLSKLVVLKYKGDKNNYLVDFNSELFRAFIASFLYYNRNKNEYSGSEIIEISKVKKEVSQLLERVYKDSIDNTINLYKELEIGEEEYDLD